MDINVIVKQKLKAKNWNFAEIADLESTVDELSEYVYDTLTAKEKLDLIWNEKIGDNMTFGGLFQEIAREAISEVVAKAIKNELEQATVSFKRTAKIVEGDKNEVSERHVGWKSHKERATDEKGHSED